MTHPKLNSFDKMLRFIYITGIILSLGFCNHAAKVLVVVPTASISHQVVFRPLTQELVKRGHEVVVITTDPVFPKGQTPQNLTEIDTHDLSYGTWRKLMSEYIESSENTFDLKAHLKKFQAYLLNTFEAQCKLDEVQDIIHNKNHTFDLIIAEAWTRYALGFSHAIRAPVILFSSFGAMYDNYNVIGAPSHPLLYPYVLNTRIYNLTFWEKLTEFYNYHWIMQQYYQDEEDENRLLRKIFGADTPPLSELQNNVAMLFLNVHPIWEGNRPVPPGVIYMGGLHQNPEKELPKDLKSYLDSSKNGVIYVSFGTNVNPNVLPPEKIQAMIKALSQVSYNVLWKWNEDEMEGKPNNVMISKWFPQSDLLRHPNVKLFITQGGLQSTDEAITAGVPMIGIPVMGDQKYNVEKYVHHKIGLYIDLKNLDEESLKNAITNIIEEKSYRENIIHLKALMNDQSMSPLERAVWWTEHVLRHGGARHLRAPAANMSWAEYYEIDVVLTVLGAALVALVLSFLVVYLIVKTLKNMLWSSVKVKKL